MNEIVMLGNYREIITIRDMMKVKVEILSRD